MLASILGGEAGKVPPGSDSCRSAWGALQTSPSSRGVPCGVRNTFVARSPPQKRAAVLSASWCRGSVV